MEIGLQFFGFGEGIESWGCVRLWDCGLFCDMCSFSFFGGGGVGFRGVPVF